MYNFTHKVSFSVISIFKKYIHSIMKKFIILQCFFLATFSVVWSQNYVNFGIRYQNTIKGDMIVVGNSILNVGDYPANHG